MFVLMVARFDGLFGMLPDAALFDDWNELKKFRTCITQVRVNTFSLIRVVSVHADQHVEFDTVLLEFCLLYTSPSPRDS